MPELSYLRIRVIEQLILTERVRFPRGIFCSEAASFSAFQINYNKCETSEIYVAVRRCLYRKNPRCIYAKHHRFTAIRCKYFNLGDFNSHNSLVNLKTRK